MPTQFQVSATGGTDFYRQIAVFAYGSFLQGGLGAAVISEGEFRTHGDGLFPPMA